MWKEYRNIIKKLVDSFSNMKRKLKLEKEIDLNCKSEIKSPKTEKEFYKGEYFFDFKNGLRCVYPYYFQYYSFAKRRWIGKTVYEMYNEEFYFKKHNTLKNLFKNEKVIINDIPVKENYLIKDGDIISTKVHRHENNVLAIKINIIKETDDLLVINKPSSIPVHSTGKYRLNSILSILYKEHGYKKLFTIHRLDRLTSGVLIFAKNKDIAVKIQKSILSRECEKEYICKVEGVFPDNEIICNQPISRLEFKIGLHMVKPNGKESITIFKKLYSDGKTSIVHCIPKTGRTHQIRVHLQYLGYPILNDPLYNSFSFGPNKGKNAEYLNIDSKELCEIIYKEHPAAKYLESSIEIDNSSFEFNEETNEDSINKIKEIIFNFQIKHLEITDEDIDKFILNLKEKYFFNYPEQIEFLKANKHLKFDKSKFKVDAVCENCRFINKKGTIEERILFLHGLRYYNNSFNEFSFYAEPPEWAKFSNDFDFKTLSYQKQDI